MSNICKYARFNNNNEDEDGDELAIVIVEIEVTEVSYYNRDFSIWLVLKLRLFKLHFFLGRRIERTTTLEWCFNILFSNLVILSIH